MKILWFDIINSPHVNFLKPIILRYQKSYKIIITTRSFAETVELIKSQINIYPIVIGSYGGQYKFYKMCQLISRLIRLFKRIKIFNVSISCGGIEATIIAKLYNKIAITFDDNDISPNQLYSKFVDYAFFPKAIPINTLMQQGFKKSRIIQYDGYKEEFYIASHKFDLHFTKRLPFSDYVIVRPENLKASYIKKRQTIVPQLLQMLNKAKYNVLFLPRYKEEVAYVQDLKNIYIPDCPINGLDAVFHAKAVLSGAGTLAREAACLGKPAVSFYPDENLLSVDKKMIADGWLFHSRDPEEIIEYIKNAIPRAFDKNRGINLQHFIFFTLDKILEQH